MKQLISRRSFLQAAGIGALSVGLAACGGSPSSSSKPSSSSSSSSKPASSGSFGSTSSSGSSSTSATEIIWLYKVTGSNTATLTGYDEKGLIPSGNVTLPSVLDGYTITRIGENCFRDSEACEGLASLTGVTVPNTVKVIEDSAFCNCENLTAVSLPEGLEVIDDYAFGYTSAQTFNIPSTVTTIGEGAFSDVPISGTLVIPATVKTVGPQAFCGTNISSLIVKGDTTFENEMKHGKPDGATFAWSWELESIVFEGSNGTLPELMFQRSDKITSVVFPKGLVTIPSGMFSCCESLTEIVIPDSVQNVDGFDNCVNLEKVSLPNSVKSIRGFNGCEKLTNITLPQSLEKIEDYAFQESGLVQIIIPEKVTSIGWLSFQACTNLKKIYIPASMKTIEAQAFGKCTNLTDVYYGGSEVAWKNVNIIAGEGEYGLSSYGDNTCLTEANIHYNASPSTLSLL